MRAWLQLMRLPAVFTALADICAGFAVRNGGFEPAGGFVGLLLASAGLYLAGMVFNDVFDRERDAVERPGRPIPSGRVRLRSAATLGTLLMAGGVAAAATVSREAFGVATGLAACVLAYDIFLKATPLGPLAMGGCRFLNVMLGAAAVSGGGGGALWAGPQTVVAAAIGVYVVGVTWFARTEEKASRRGLLVAGALVANLGMAILAGSYSGRVEFLKAPWRGLIDFAALTVLVLGIMAMIDMRVLRAVIEPSPRGVQRTVKSMLLSIILLDATAVLAATGDRPLALGVAAMVVPAVLVGRWVYVT